MRFETVTLKPGQRPRYQAGGAAAKPREGQWSYPESLGRRKAAKTLANFMILSRERKIKKLQQEIAVLRRTR